MSISPSTGVLPLESNFLVPNGTTGENPTLELSERLRMVELRAGLTQTDEEHGHGYNLPATRHTGATWFRRGRSIRMSCKPRSPVGLVNPPAQRKCEERSRTRCLTPVSQRRRPGCARGPEAAPTNGLGAEGELIARSATPKGSASASVGRLHPGRRANRKGSLCL